MCAKRSAENNALSDRLSIILEATADLNDMLGDPQRLYASLLERLDDAVPSYSSSLQVMDGDTARIVAFRGDLDPDVVMGLRFTMDPLFPNYEVVRTQRPVAFADIRDAYPHFFSRQEEFNSGHIRSWLGVPMVASGAVIGMIALDRNVVDPFDEDEIRIVMGFADHAAVAIRNARTYRELQDALAAQDALMREMHHRVKNNLQLVSSLIDIHAGIVQEEATRVSLEELQMRIRSISAIHERLYERSDMRVVDLDDYLLELARDVFESFHRAESAVSLRAELCNIPADMATAVPLGLITSELIMNALKYAFPYDVSGTVTIRLARTARGGELTIEDTGIGMRQDEGGGGFGILLVRNLAQQLCGESRLVSRPGCTSWIICFPVES